MPAMDKVSEQRNGRRRRHAGLAWLAVLALLIEALLPTAIAAVAALDPAAAGGSLYCGATPAEPGPAKQSRTAPHHCILCLAATNGLAPGHPPAAPAPRFAEIAVAAFASSEGLSEPLAYMAAQPRGPPVAA
jgi:hypothetical protein